MPPPSPEACEVAGLGRALRLSWHGADAGESLPLPARPHRVPVIDCALRPTRRAGCDCKHRYCRARTALACMSPPPPSPLCLRSSRVARTCFVILRPVSLPPPLKCHPPLPCPTSKIPSAGSLGDSSRHPIGVDRLLIGRLFARSLRRSLRGLAEGPLRGTATRCHPPRSTPPAVPPPTPLPPPRTPSTLLPAGHSLPGIRSVGDRAPPRFPC